MAMESPLFLTRVECPICATVNEFETIRVGAYTEGDRQSDFCPSVIKWRNPKYQRYHPLLFFTATCAHCFYTREFNVKFKDWAKDNNFRTYRLKVIKEKHLSDLAAADSFISKVGGLLDNEKYPQETAILKLLLAIYDELLYDHPSNLDLGRFYLRIAWLYRHSAARSDGGQLFFDIDPMANVERTFSDLHTWVAGLGRTVEYFKDSVAEYTASVQTEESEALPARNLFAGAIERLENIGAECGRILSEIETGVSTEKSSPGGPASTIFDGSYYNHASFDEFLTKLARMWDGVPRNEYEALRFATRYYVNAFETGKEISHGNQSIQAAYLIAELSRRIRDHDTARRYFNTTIKMGQDYINEIKGDRTRTVLTRKLLELALAQGKKNLAEAK